MISHNSGINPNSTCIALFAFHGKPRRFQNWRQNAVFLKKNVNHCTKEKRYLKWEDLETEFASGFRWPFSSVGALWLWCPMVQIITQRHAFHWFHCDKSRFLFLRAFPGTRDFHTLMHTKPTEIVLSCFWQIPKHSELQNFLSCTSDGDIWLLGL